MAAFDPQVSASPLDTVADQVPPPPVVQAPVPVQNPEQPQAAQQPTQPPPSEEIDKNLAPGQRTERKMREAGFGENDINEWRDQKVERLKTLGLSETEVGEYFGIKPAPDMDKMRSQIETNLKNNLIPGNFPGMEQPGNIDLSNRPQVKNEDGSISTVRSVSVNIDGKEILIPTVSDSGKLLNIQESIDQYKATGKNLGIFKDAGSATKYAQALHEDQAKFIQAQQKPVQSLIDAIEAGFQISNLGMVLRDKAPDKILPQDSPAFYRIASQLSSLVGDIPTMIAGAMAGGAAGTAAGGPVGSAIGAGAGAMALPQAIRSTLMQHYEKGDVQSFQDFWERSSAVFLDTLKAGVTGGATAGIAGPVAKLVGPLAAPQLVKAGAVTASEIATMVTVGKALDGQAPNPEDFLDAAILIGGMHAAIGMAGKLRDIYSETGVKPTDLAEMAKDDPSIKQDLLSSNVDVPKALDQPDAKAGPEEKPTPKPSRELSDAEKKIAEHISIEDKKTVDLSEGSVPAVDLLPTKDEWKQIYTKTLDQLYPVKDFVDILTNGIDLKALTNPYKLMRLMGGNAARAAVFLKKETYDFLTLKKTGDSLQTVLDPIKDDLTGFRIFTVAKRAIELSERKKLVKGETQDAPIKTGIDLNDAKSVVDQGEAKYGPVAKELYDYQNRVIDYLVDSGVLHSKDANAFREANKHYVPFNRLLEDEGKAVGKSSGSGNEPRNPIKRINGSERAIVDPIETIIKNTHYYITMAERNRAMLAMKRLADSGGKLGQELMEHLPARNRAIDVKSEEVAALLKEYGIEDIDPTHFTIFRPDKSELANNEIAVYDKGKKQIYKVSEGVATAVRALDRESMNVVIKFLNVSVKTLRAGVTLSPDFIGRNVWRDQVPAYVQSKNGYIPYWSAIDGLKTIFKDQEAFTNWQKGGGGNADITSLGTDYVTGDISKIAGDTGFMDRVINVAKKPIDLLHIMSELSEQSSRVGDFKLGTKNDQSAGNIFEQAYNARELVIDYHKIGASNSIRAMNLITAFWNARVQGLERTVRAFKDDLPGTTMKTLASVTLPSLILWGVNSNDPRWNDGTIPRWQKDLFWIVMTKEHIYRIPKPFELGILFGSIPERLCEAYIKHNPKAYQDLASTVLQGVNPGFIPTFVSPFIEHFGNKSLFTSGPIIPHNLEGMLPSDQYTDYTTESAKKIGQFVRIFDDRPGGFSSPAVVENYVRSWSGNTGLYALQLADQALIKAGISDDSRKPEAKIEEWPFIKAFMIKNPTRQNQNIQDFYQKFADSQAEIKSFKHRMQSSNQEGAMRILEKSGSLMNLNSFQQSLSNQDSMVHKIIQNPDIPKDQKSQMVDGMISGMIETATQGLSVYDEFEKEFKQMKKK